MRDIRTSTTATGALGIMGNKGAVVTRFNLYDSSLCFVNCHFHSDKDSLLSRNADFHSILDSTLLSLAATTEEEVDGNNVSKEINPSRYLAGQDRLPENLKILDHDYIFWMGDLNYRIIEDIDSDEIFARCAAGDWEYLKSRDQLNCERAKGTVFADFEEGAITFAPTYKYQSGTDIYERRSDKRVRAPAWCDRVLWRAQESGQKALRLLQYRRAPVYFSDHTPVSAVLRAEVKRISATALQAIYRELLHSVDKWVNAAAPRLEIDSRMVDLGIIGCDVRTKLLIFSKIVFDKMLLFILLILTLFTALLISSNFKIVFTPLFIYSLNFDVQNILKNIKPIMTLALL